MPWWDPRGECGRNCSFFSGEGATAFWTYAPAALTPPAWRPLAYAAATLFGVVTQGLRMAFGGHFFTDVAAAGLVSFLVIWLAYGWLFRWPSTRVSDGKVEAALARLGPARPPPVAALPPAQGGRESGLPGAIKRVPIRAKFVIRALKAASDIRHFDRLEAP